MSKLVGPVLAALIAGCVQDPAQVRESGILRTLELKADYRTAGQCVVRTAESEGLLSSTRWDEKLRKAEIVAQSTRGFPGSEAHTSWVMDIQEYRGKTLGLLHYSRLGFPFGKDPAELFKACSG